MKRLKMKAVGQPNSWFADVGGILLPVVHSTYCVSRAGVCAYHDTSFQPSLGTGSVKMREYVEALRRSEHCIVQMDKTVGKNKLRHDYYVGVFSIEYLEHSEEMGLFFTFNQWLIDCTP